MGVGVWAEEARGVDRALVVKSPVTGEDVDLSTKLYADDGENVVIRPLAYCAEEDIAAFARVMAFPIVPCDLCGTQENLQRQQIKALIGSLAEKNPNVKGNMLTALKNVRVSHLLDLDLLALSGGRPSGGDDTLNQL